VSAGGCDCLACMEDVCVPLTAHTYARLARGLAFLLVAVATVVTVCVLGPVAALGAPAVGAQNRAGAFNPPGVLPAGGPSAENPCSRQDSNAPGGGIAAGCFVGDEDAAAADLAEDGSYDLYHYTTADRAEQILGDGQINPSSDGNTYLTPDRYADGPEAQSRLAMGTEPEGYIRVPAPPGYIRVPAPPGAPEPGPVVPAKGQPGGGLEVPVPGPVWFPAIATVIQIAEANELRERSEIGFEVLAELVREPRAILVGGWDAMNYLLWTPEFRS
jgi:hypothetical protein